MGIRNVDIKRDIDWGGAWARVPTVITKGSLGGLGPTEARSSGSLWDTIAGSSGSLGGLGPTEARYGTQYVCITLCWRYKQKHGARVLGPVVRRTWALVSIYIIDSGGKTFSKDSELKLGAILGVQASWCGKTGARCPKDLGSGFYLYNRFGGNTISKGVCQRVPINPSRI